GARTDRLAHREIRLVLLRHVRQCVVAGRIDEQCVDRLLEFSALHLEYRGFRPRCLAGGDCRQRAQLGVLERPELDLDLPQPASETTILEQGDAAVYGSRRFLPQPAHAVLGARDSGNVGALVLQQHLAVRPAFPFLADEVLDRHFHVLEMHLVDLALALDCDDRLHRDSGRTHVDEQEADPFLAPRDVRTGADETKNPVCKMRERGPGFRAVHDIVVPTAVRAGLERGKVRAGARFGIALAPPHVALQDVGKKPRLLRVVTEGIYHRRDHLDAEGDHLRRIRRREFIREYVLLDRRPAGAAILDRPVDRGPALLVENLLPTDDIVLAERDAPRLLLSQVSRILLLQEGPNLIAKCEFTFRIIYAHHQTLLPQPAADQQQFRSSSDWHPH